MLFDPERPAREMKCAELMASHIAMRQGVSAVEVVGLVKEIYNELDRQMGDEEDSPLTYNDLS